MVSASFENDSKSINPSGGLPQCRVVDENICTRFSVQVKLENLISQGPYWFTSVTCCEGRTQVCLQHVTNVIMVHIMGTIFYANICN